jgi:N-acetylglucosaminyldiphosphoundecaprenol N-acetyl-beta-D-mannosaminyltransferase
MMLTKTIIGSRVDAVSYEEATAKIIEWSQERKGRFVCAAPVHSVLIGHDSAEHRGALAAADLVTPDGAPVAWALRKLGCHGQRRVSGPDLMLRVLDDAAKKGIPVGLFGSSQKCIDLLKVRLPEKAPGLNIVYAVSPPFHALSEEEDKAVHCQIKDSGARILFVALGCPKQELWMAEHRDKVDCVMVGVGAAFDMHAGLIRRAPRWMRDIGLEWLFRLVFQPRRLFYRYLVYCPRFFVLFAKQLRTQKGTQSTS